MIKPLHPLHPPTQGITLQKQQLQANIRQRKNFRQKVHSIQQNVWISFIYLCVRYVFILSHPWQMIIQHFQTPQPYKLALRPHCRGIIGWDGNWCYHGDSRGGVWCILIEWVVLWGRTGCAGFAERTGSWNITPLTLVCQACHVLASLCVCHPADLAAERPIMSSCESSACFYRLIRGGRYHVSGC